MRETGLDDVKVSNFTQILINFLFTIRSNLIQLKSSSSFDISLLTIFTHFVVVVVAPLRRRRIRLLEIGQIKKKMMIARRIGGNVLNIFFKRDELIHNYCCIVTAKWRCCYYFLVVF